MATQRAEVLHMLENATGGWITTHDIRAVGIVNGPERIAELRRDGHPIEDETITIRGKRATRYRLVRARVMPSQQEEPAPPATALFELAFDDVCPPPRNAILGEEAA